MTPSSPAKPNIERTPDGFTVTWAKDGVLATVERIEEHRDGITCLLNIDSTRPTSAGMLLAFASFNLTAVRSRTELANKMAKADPDLAWAEMIEQLVIGVLERHKQGEPTIDMRFYDDPGGSMWHLEPFLTPEGPTVLFGDGGVGKSLVAMAMLATLAGAPILGVPYETGPTLFLDYEGTSRGFSRRLQALCAGSGHPIPPVHYRREFASLPEAAAPLRREIRRLGVKTVAIDSVGLACGGSPEAADVTLAFFRAVDSLQVPCLLVDHVTKNGGLDQTKAYGSVYKHNRPRLAWKIVSKQDDVGRRIVGMSEHKHNDFAELPPMGYRVSYEVDGNARPTKIAIGYADPRAAFPESLRDRIVAVLLDSRGPMLPAVVAEMLGEDRHQIGSRMSELAKDGGPLIRSKDGKGYAVRAREN